MMSELSGDGNLTGPAIITKGGEGENKEFPPTINATPPSEETSTASTSLGLTSRLAFVKPPTAGLALAALAGEDRPLSPRPSAEKLPDNLHGEVSPGVIVASNDDMQVLAALGIMKSSELLPEIKLDELKDQINKIEDSLKDKEKEKEKEREEGEGEGERGGEVREEEKEQDVLSGKKRNTEAPQMFVILKTEDFEAPASFFEKLKSRQESISHTISEMSTAQKVGLGALAMAAAPAMLIAGLPALFGSLVATSAVAVNVAKEKRGVADVLEDIVPGLLCLRESETDIYERFTNISMRTLEWRPNVVYRVHPFRPGCYIAIGEFNKFLRFEKRDELINIMRGLGARSLVPVQAESIKYLHFVETSFTDPVLPSLDESAVLWYKYEPDWQEAKIKRFLNLDSEAVSIPFKMDSDFGVSNGLAHDLSRAGLEVGDKWRPFHPIDATVNVYFYTTPHYVEKHKTTLRAWNNEDVIGFLHSLNLGRFEDAFKDKDGSDFVLCNERVLASDFQMPEGSGDAVKLLDAQQRLFNNIMCMHPSISNSLPDDDTQQLCELCQARIKSIMTLRDSQKEKEEEAKRIAEAAAYAYASIRRPSMSAPVGSHNLQDDISMMLSCSVPNVQLPRQGHSDNILPGELSNQSYTDINLDINAEPTIQVQSPDGQQITQSMPTSAYIDLATHPAKRTSFSLDSGQISSDYVDFSGPPAQSAPAGLLMHTFPLPTGPKADPGKTQFREIDYSELMFGKVIGSGSFGTVYKGTWRGATVAIKKLHELEKSFASEEAIAEFRREASLCEYLSNHPNIASFVGACASPFCIVTRYYKNKSLEHIIIKHSSKKYKNLPIATIVKMLKDAAAGILHLHCEGIIHRDIAARNVLVAEDMSVHVADFGFSRLKEIEAEYGVTKSSVGPIKWMSPEAIQDKKYSEKSDVYSFGIMIWEVVSGKEPYPGEGPLQVAIKVVKEDYRPTIPADCHPALARLMRSCWATNPDDRPAFGVIIEKLNKIYSLL